MPLIVTGSSIVTGSFRPILLSKTIHESCAQLAEDSSCRRVLANANSYLTIKVRQKLDPWWQ